MFLKRIFFNVWVLFNLFLKTIVDFIGSLILLILLLPIMIIISVVIKIDSKGPVLFRQNRLTKKGKVFKMLKFRTMIVNAESIGTGLFSYDGDPRITKVGQVLRKTSLDELPQLFNILTLRMSFVGPRPPVDYELGIYDDLSDDFKNRFRMKAGITGLAQVKGRNELEWDFKVLKDNEYIEKFYKIGFIYDIYLVILTVFKVFKKENINEKEPDYLKGLSEEEKREIMMEEVSKKASGYNNE